MSEEKRPRILQKYDYEVQSSQELIDEFFESSLIWKDIQGIMDEAFDYLAMKMWRSHESLDDIRTKGHMDAIEEFQDLQQIMTEMKISTEPEPEEDQDEKEEDHG